MDFLKQLIDDYNAGRVDLGQTLNRLEFDMWKKDKAPIPEDYMKVPLDPLDIMLEKERTMQLEDMLDYLKKELDSTNWKILVKVARGERQEDIAADLGISQSRVSRRLQTIRKHSEGLDELLRKMSPVYTADSPKIKIRYPMDAAQENRKHCEIPEYLAECFGDDFTRCCLCDNCKRKRANGLC